MQMALRQLQRASGVVLLVYIALHLINHALGMWSLELAERGLTLAIRLWHSAPGTVLLFGAFSVHFALALRTVYGRRHWALSPIEWVRLWAALSLPFLLIRHAVTTRVAASFYDFDPTYAKVVVSLIMSGTQGLQLALLAPGWVHGCLGIWIRVRHHRFARRVKPVLVGLFVLLPLLSAAGFVHMTRAVVSAHSTVLSLDPNLRAHRLTLDAWRHALLAHYLFLIVGAFLAGQARNRLEGQGHRKASLDV